MIAQKKMDKAAKAEAAHDEELEEVAEHQPEAITPVIEYEGRWSNNKYID